MSAETDDLAPPPDDFPPFDFAVIRSAGTICRWNGHYWKWHGGEWVAPTPIPARPASPERTED